MFANLQSSILNAIIKVKVSEFLIQQFIISFLKEVLQKMTEINGKDLQQEGKYYSFIICRTKDINLSQKFPFVVTTINGRICNIGENQQLIKDYQFNHSFDCINYEMDKTRLILSQGDWMKPLLKPKQRNLLQTYEIVDFEGLQLSGSVEFYFYHKKKQQFHEMRPKYLLSGDCIIFERISSKLSLVLQLNFKRINFNSLARVISLLSKNRQRFASSIYSFTCEYGIMSDIHFNQSFVARYKSISSYTKMTQGKIYIHFISQKILKYLLRLYPGPNL